MTDEWPVGAPVDRVPVGRDFERVPLEGRSVSLVPVCASEHLEGLYESFCNSDPQGLLWTYMGYGPFAGLSDFQEWLTAQETSTDPLYYAIVPRDTGIAAGMASFLRMNVHDGVAEIGNIWFAPSLQKSRASSEAIFAMMRHVLDTQRCRRLEWKCNALNAPSRDAAVRYGFTFEGIFRNHMVIKGRNRDTAWYAITEEEWPPLRSAFETWLDDENFDQSGIQKQSLRALIARVRQ